MYVQIETIHLQQNIVPLYIQLQRNFYCFEWEVKTDKLNLPPFTQMIHFSSYFLNLTIFLNAKSVFFQTCRVQTRQYNASNFDEIDTSTTSVTGGSTIFPNTNIC